MDLEMKVKRLERQIAQLNQLHEREREKYIRENGQLKKRIAALKACYINFKDAATLSLWGQDDENA